MSSAKRLSWHCGTPWCHRASTRSSTYFPSTPAATSVGAGSYTGTVLCWPRGSATALPSASGRLYARHRAVVCLPRWCGASRRTWDDIRRQKNPVDEYHVA